MASHTPGPWYAAEGECEDEFEVVSSDGAIIAQPPSEADANLIAAAPELLAACQRFVAFHATDHPGLTYLAAFRELHAAMCDAIAKAEGAANGK